MKARQLVKDLWETAHPDSLGFVELCNFFYTATQTQLNQMGKACKENDWDSFKKLIQEVSGGTIKDETNI